MSIERLFSRAKEWLMLSSLRVRGLEHAPHHSSQKVSLFVHSPRVARLLSVVISMDSLQCVCSWYCGLEILMTDQLNAHVYHL